MNTRKINNLNKKIDAAEEAGNWELWSKLCQEKKELIVQDNESAWAKINTCSSNFGKQSQADDYRAWQSRAIFGRNA